MAKKMMTAADLAAQAEAAEAAEIQQAFERGTNTLRDLISPSAIEIHSDYFRLGTKYGRTLYVYGYPRSLYTGWISPIINMDEVIDVSMYIYPVESAVVMKNLRTKVTQLEASMNINAEKGRVLEVPQSGFALPRFAAMLGFAFPCAMGVFTPVAPVGFC